MATISARSEAFDSKKLAKSTKPTTRMQLMVMFTELAYKLSEDQTFLDHFLKGEDINITIENRRHGWDYQFGAFVELNERISKGKSQ